MNGEQHDLVFTRFLLALCVLGFVVAISVAQAR
jgi:hypothetical protein